MVGGGWFHLYSHIKDTALPLRDITQSRCHTEVEGLLLTGRLQLQQWSLSWWRFLPYFAAVLFILGWRCANIVLKIISPMENGDTQINRKLCVTFKSWATWCIGSSMDLINPAKQSKSHELRYTPPVNSCFQISPGDRPLYLYRSNNKKKKKNITSLQLFNPTFIQSPTPLLGEAMPTCKSQDLCHKT